MEKRFYPIYDDHFRAVDLANLLFRNDGARAGATGSTCDNSLNYTGARKGDGQRADPETQAVSIRPNIQSPIAD